MNEYKKRNNEKVLNVSALGKCQHVLPTFLAPKHNFTKCAFQNDTKTHFSYTEL